MSPESYPETPSNGEFCLVLTTCGDRASAERLATLLLQRRLVACVQLQDIRSFYHWQGSVQSESEVLLLIKTRTAAYSALEAAIRELHDYQVPEIVQLPITLGLADYLSWVRQETRSS